MSKEALNKIEAHEKLCRIMQKQTHDKINNLESLKYNDLSSFGDLYSVQL